MWGGRGLLCSSCAVFPWLHRAAGRVFVPPRVDFGSPALPPPPLHARLPLPGRPPATHPAPGSPPSAGGHGWHPAPPSPAPHAPPDAPRASVSPAGRCLPRPFHGVCYLPAAALASPGTWGRRAASTPRPHCPPWAKDPKDPGSCPPPASATDGQGAGVPLRDLPVPSSSRRDLGMPRAQVVGCVLLGLCGCRGGLGDNMEWVGVCVPWGWASGGVCRWMVPCSAPMSPGVPSSLGGDGVDLGGPGMSLAHRCPMPGENIGGGSIVMGVPCKCQGGCGWVPRGHTSRGRGAYG